MSDRGRYSRERGEPDYGDYRQPYERSYHEPNYYHPGPDDRHQPYGPPDTRRPPPPRRPYDDDYSNDYRDRPPPPRRPRYDPDDGGPPLRGSREAEHYESRSHASHDRAPPRPKSAPSLSVIFLGLPPDTTSESLQHFLLDIGASVDSAVVIRDKVTGESKRFGFARFASVEHARTFVDSNFPVIVWEDPGSPYDGMRIKIDFSQSDKMQSHEGKASDSARVAGPSKSTSINDGTKDIGSAPSRYLFLRGLDSLVTEFEIAESFQAAIARKAAAEGYQPGDGGLCRIMLVKDRQSTASWGFAFAEYADVKAAIEGLKTVMSPKVNPQGFKIGSTTVGVTFAHSESFKPDYTASEWSIKDLETFKDILYWDNQAYLVVKELPAAQKLLEQRQKPSEEVDPDEEFFASLEQDLNNTEQQKQQTTPATENPSKVTIPSVKLTAVALPSKEKPASKSESVEKPKTGEKRKQREPELIAAKKNSVAIEHWNRKKQEDEEKPALMPSEEISVDPFPYGDPVKFQCLLCSRQFKELNTLKRHDEQSELHKGNLKNPEAIQKATAAKARLQPWYRDRAAERRIALNQPDKPISESGSFKRVKVDAPPPAAQEPPPVQPNKEGIEASNIGRKMLEAAGWTQGEGLGAGGSATPIEARQYQAGVGLGAAPSTAISDLPSDASWRNPGLGRDKARARYTQGQP